MFIKRCIFGNLALAHFATHFLSCHEAEPEILSLTWSWKVNPFQEVHITLLSDLIAHFVLPSWPYCSFEGHLKALDSLHKSSKDHAGSVTAPHTWSIRSSINQLTWCAYGSSGTRPYCARWCDVNELRHGRPKGQRNRDGHWWWSKDIGVKVRGTEMDTHGCASMSKEHAVCVEAGVWCGGYDVAWVNEGGLILTGRQLAWSSMNIVMVRHEWKWWILK